MDLLARLQDIKNNEFGLIGGKLSMSHLDMTGYGHLMACIDTEIWDVDFQIDKKWKPHKDKKIRNFLIANGQDPDAALEIILSDTLRHECRHWSENMGCSCNSDYRFMIEEATAKAITEAGKDPLKPVFTGQSLAGYFRNMFSDFVLNTSNKYLCTPYSGQTLFFYDQGAKGEYPKLFEFFVKMNMKSWGTDIDYKLVKPFMKTRISVKKLSNEIGLKDLKSNAKRLSNPRSWKKNAYLFTKEALKYHKDVKLPKLSFVISRGPSSDLGKMAKDRFEKGQGPPASVSRIDFLDALYQELASDIAVKSYSDKASMSFPLVNYGPEPFDFTTHDIHKIDLSRVFFDKDSPLAIGPLTFANRRFHDGIPIAYNKKMPGFTDVAMILDDSGSMFSGKENPALPWGEDCNYHYAALALYGLINHAKKMNLAPAVSWNLTRFSDRTKSSGWVGYENLLDIRKTTLDEYCGWNTVLDMAVLKKQLTRSPCSVILVSDGGIFNWKKIRDSFLNLIEPHYFAFLSTGRSGTAKDLEKCGKEVIYIEKPSDMYGLVIDLMTKN